MNRVALPFSNDFPPPPPGEGRREGARAHERSSRFEHPLTLSFSRRERGHKAFTLLELLVAMAMAAILVGSLYSAMRVGFGAESRAEAAVEPVRTAELAMGLLRPDLESAVAGAVGTGTTLIGPFTGTDTAGDGGTPADTVEFYTLGDPLDGADPTGQSNGNGMGMNLGGRASGTGTGPNGGAGALGAFGTQGAYGDAGTYVPGTGEVRMIDLMVVPTATGNALVRRVTTNLLSQNGTPTYYDEVVCRGVRSFNLRYFDGSAWQESWDSTQLGDTAPTAVEVTIELQRGDANQPKVLRFARVFLVSSSTLWQTATTAAGGAVQ